MIKDMNGSDSYITPTGGNVFLDLGFGPHEAAILKEETDRIISSKLAIRESLMTEVANWIKSNGLTNRKPLKFLVLPVHVFLTSLTRSGPSSLSMRW